MNTLREIDHCVSMGYSVKFARFVNQIEISVTDKNNESKMSVLPFDHLYDSKIADCIRFLRESLL